MPRPDTSPRTLLYDRTVRSRVEYLDPTRCRTTATLVDESVTEHLRPTIVHDMSLLGDFDPRSMELLWIDARMDTRPHGSCTLAVAPVQQLVGLTLGRGFSTAAAARTGGAQGCSHMRTLVDAMVTASVLSHGARVALELDSHEIGDQQAFLRRILDTYPAIVDSCQGWRADGPVVRGLQSGDDASSSGDSG